MPFSLLIIHVTLPLLKGHCDFANVQPEPGLTGRPRQWHQSRRFKFLPQAPGLTGRPSASGAIWNLGTLWNHIWFNDIMKCHYDIIVSWYHSFMISWFGEFGYHSRVILDIIYAFIYMKSLYDFTISLNHIWYHSYEKRYDFMLLIS